MMPQVPRNPSERWLRVARVYNRLNTLVKEAAKQPKKVKAIKLHFEDKDEAKTLKGLFKAGSPPYRKLNSKQHSHLERPFLYLRPAKAAQFRLVMFNFLFPEEIKKLAQEGNKK